MFDQLLDIKVSDADRYGGRLSLIMFDIDNFKKINDTYGHQVGDEVLKQVAKVVEREVRKADIFARYGGEEFAVICPNTSKEKAQELAKRIREVVKNTIEVEGKPVTISLGVAEYKRDGILNKEDLVKAADEALYVSKKTGKDKVSTYVNKPLSIDTVIKEEQVPPKVVVADIGGALAPAEGKTIKDSPNLLQSLLFWLRMGGLLILLTSGSLERAKKDVLNFIPQELRNKIVVFAENGAYVYVDGQVIEENYFTNEEREKIKDIFELVIKQLKIEGLAYVRKKDLVEDKAKMVLEIKDPSKTLEIYNKVKEEVEKNNLNYAVYYSEKKVTIAKVSKREGIRKIIKYFELQPSEFLYLGNSFKEGQADYFVLDSAVRCVDVSDSQQNVYKIFKFFATKILSKNTLFRFDKIEGNESIIEFYSKFKLREESTINKVVDLLTKKIKEEIKGIPVEDIVIVAH